MTEPYCVTEYNERKRAMTENRCPECGADIATEETLIEGLARLLRESDAPNDPPPNDDELKVAAELKAAIDRAGWSDVR